ncbi:hypothetical protein B0A55_00325 [Friedmanniomyces simplex]|uniref:Uncharacterized protein n=1 Tax=Friedmanniomyces simplex TaxID=329884 RepID=A0A4U0Y1Z4_9PEZI|nr:hypothetical protein B0A55_00325 [Friedmanniomyces simplex]
MARSSIAKSSSNLPVSSAAPTYTNQPVSDDFLPKYEETVNSNLRNFGDPEAQHGNFQHFDGIQEPAVMHGLAKKRRALIFAGGKQQSPLSTRATETQRMQTTSTAFGAPASQPTSPADASPSVIPATTLMTTTVAGPSSQLFTSYITVTAGLQTTESPNTSPPIISATTFITRTAAGASSELFTSFTTVSENPQTTFFNYSLAATSSSTSTPYAVLQANKSAAVSIASVLSSLQAHATPSPITPSHTRIVPSEKLPSPPPATKMPVTTSFGAIVSLPSLTSAATPLPSGGWINYCGVPGSSCDE